MSATCPSCGVAVVPGYVKCPKCKKPLPNLAGASRLGLEGGTAVPDRQFPIAAIAVPVAIVVALVVYFGFVREGGKAADPPQTPATTATTQQTARPTTQAVDVNTGGPAVPETNTAAAAPALERALQKQRLWSTVEAFGSRLDIRSNACGDAAMQPAVDAQKPALASAKVTQVRCLAPGGSVVFTRDL